VRVKNAIYFFAFIFILVGVFGITAWVALDQLQGTVLSYAAIVLLWGITLVVLYVAFDKAGWDWWEG
jgi:hypothetical protein